MPETLPDLSIDATRVAAAALAEDGLVDLTTAVTVRTPVAGEATIEARASCVVAGLLYAATTARAAGC
jgi:nicotinate-nucleotide pyrophosphorylase